MKIPGGQRSGLVVVMLLLLWFTGLAPGAEEWTAKDGRVIGASFVRLEGDSVVIEMDGKQFSVPLAKLSEDSAALALELAEAPSATSGRLSPQRFLGKSMVECEAVLGSPDRIQEAEEEGQSSSYYFYAPGPGILRVRLECAPEGNQPPELVTTVWYYFSKGRVRTVGQCFKLTGTDFTGGYRLFNMFRDVAADDLLSETQYVRIEGIPGRLVAGWEPAAFGKDRPPEYRHEHEDAISFQKQRGLTTWQRYQRMREKSAAP